jgi:hypothetical protein
MQVVPCIAYYMTYYKRKGQLILNQTTYETADVDYLNDDAASDLNRSLTASNSRSSLFSRDGSRPQL